MDESAFKECVRRLEEVNGVVSKLDPVLRSEAFALLKAYVTGGQDPSTPPAPKAGNGRKPTKKASTAKHTATARPKRNQPTAAEPTDDEDVLLEQHLSDTDHENAMLAVALCYKRHGRGPFDLAHIKGIAQQYKLNMPKRLDKFFLTAKRGDAKVIVLRRQADGWKITPGGETWLKATYNVPMGRDPLPMAET